MNVSNGEPDEQVTPIILLQFVTLALQFLLAKLIAKGTII